MKGPHEIIGSKSPEVYTGPSQPWPEESGLIKQVCHVVYEQPDFKRRVQPRIQGLEHFPELIHQTLHPDNQEDDLADGKKSTCLSCMCPPLRHSCVGLEHGSIQPTTESFVIVMRFGAQIGYSDLQQKS